MKKKIKLIIAAFLVSSFSITSLPFEAAGQENACQIKAGLDNVYVYARDLDRDGNPLIRPRRIVFKGWILQGRSVSVKSIYGRITVSFKADSDYRGSGSNEFSCTGNQTITLP